MRERKWQILVGLLILALLALYVATNARTDTLADQNRQLSEELQESNLRSQQVSKELQETQANVTRLTEELNSRAEFEDKVLSIGRNGSPSRGISRPDIVASYNMTATAYGSQPINGGCGTGLSAIGEAPVEERTIAVDPNVIPLHSKVLIVCPSRPEINGIYRAEDTGGDIGGSRVDIYFDDIFTDPMVAHHRMMDFGTKDIIVHVLKD